MRSHAESTVYRRVPSSARLSASKGAKKRNHPSPMDFNFSDTSPQETLQQTKVGSKPNKIHCTAKTSNIYLQLFFARTAPAAKSDVRMVIPYVHNHSVIISRLLPLCVSLTGCCSVKFASPLNKVYPFHLTPYDCCSNCDHVSGRTTL